jgi:membrane-associated phospholipid phosphatase
MPIRAVLALSVALQGGPPAPAHTVRWYEAAAAAAGATALMVFDEPVQRYVQDHRSATTDDVASVFRRGGQPEVFGTLSVGLMAVGVVDHHPGLTRAAARLATSVALAEILTLGIKTVAGRARPVAGVGAFDFDPFSGAESFPSGHTTVAFALATDLADELDRGWVRVGLYTLASGTAWSRVNDNRHWLSDVGWGALVGVTSAKLVSGRWRVFGIAPPRFLVGPNGRAGIGWRM